MSGILAGLRVVEASAFVAAPAVLTEVLGLSRSDFGALHGRGIVG